MGHITLYIRTCNPAVSEKRLGTCSYCTVEGDLAIGESNMWCSRLDVRMDIFGGCSTENEMKGLPGRSYMQIR